MLRRKFLVNEYKFPISGDLLLADDCQAAEERQFLKLACSWWDGRHLVHGFAGSATEETSQETILCPSLRGDSVPAGTTAPFYKLTTLWPRSECAWTSVLSTVRLTSSVLHRLRDTPL